MIAAGNHLDLFLMRVDLQRDVDAFSFGGGA
jgi:hypothetical protein